MKNVKGVPGSNSAAYIAGRAIYARGPASQEQIFGYASFGKTSGAQTYNLGKAIANGWLIEIEGLVGLTEKARHYYAGTEPEPQEMGSLATPPTNVNAMRTLSAKYRLNPRGLRPNAMDNSLRAMPSHYAKAQS